MTAQPPLASTVERLRDVIAGLRFGVETTEAAVAREVAAGVVRQTDDYLLPRLQSLDAPLLAVVAGPTGAGKSTIVNSIVGADVSAAGVLRPTTRAPVLVCAPADRDWFMGPNSLPDLARTTGNDTGAGTLRVVAVPELRAGLALIDAPDIDSVVRANRHLATQLVAAADLWIFVTTAARYADALPWDLLTEADERDMALAIVLNRVPPNAVSEVAQDLRAMLAARVGLQGVAVFVIEEGVLVQGRLPDGELDPVREWLRSLALDAEAREALIRQTLSGALDSLGRRVTELATVLERQSAAADDLRQAADAAYEVALRDVLEGMRGGTLLRGEVLARWHDFVGGSDWTRSLQSQVGRFRDRLAAAVTGRPTPVEELNGALESSVETLLRVTADRAAERTVIAWRGIAGGEALLAGRHRELDRVSGTFSEDGRREVREWQGFVLDLVRAEAAGRRATARVLSFGVNGIGLALMITVFAHTGGLTGGELAVAGGTSALAQKLLEAVFGDAATRTLAARARDDLEARAARLLTAERERFRALVDAAAPAEHSMAELREAWEGMTTASRSEGTS